MITFELARELKEAGYPQGRQVSSWITSTGAKLWIEPTRLKPGEYAYIPDLSELIESCGDKFMNLHRNANGVWETYTIMVSEVILGDTPEKAVARLWIALNKGQDKTPPK